MDTPEFTGALIDPRPEQEKERDWLDAEVTGSASPVVWTAKKKYKFYSKRNQSSSGSCGGQAITKAQGIENHVETGEYAELSAIPNYQSRSNKGSAGMYIQEALRAPTLGLSCLEGELPSQGLNEAQMNAQFVLTDVMREQAETYRASNYVQLQNHTDIDRIASVTEDGKGVLLMFFFAPDEYWREIPVVTHDNLDRYAESTSRHFVCATDYLMRDGEKCLLIEDSAGNSSSMRDENGKRNGQRIITETFLKARCMGAGYLIDLPNKRVTKPEFRFVGTLKYGSKGNAVENLQECLKYMKLIPGNVPSTGSFLTITRQAVRDFQKANGLAVDGIFGAKSARVMAVLFPLKDN